MLHKRKLGQGLKVSAIETLDGATGEQGVSGPRYIERLAALVDR